MPPDSAPAQAPPLPAPRATGLWARVKPHILHPELSPQQVAWSFALGFSICWNPFLGLHTLLVLGLCLAFRHLHRPLVLAAAFLNNPWTMVPIATASAYLGNLLLGRGLNLDLRAVDWRAIGLASFTTEAGFRALLAMLKPILAPYLLGGLVLAALALPTGYFAMLHLTRRLRAAHLHLPHFRHPH
jgi:uncharacterized protein (DUF2062 family)